LDIGVKIALVGRKQPADRSGNPRARPATTPESQGLAPRAIAAPVPALYERIFSAEHARASFTKSAAWRQVHPLAPVTG